MQLQLERLTNTPNSRVPNGAAYYKLSPISLCAPSPSSPLSLQVGLHEGMHGFGRGWGRAWRWIWGLGRLPLPMQPHHRAPHSDIAQQQRPSAPRRRIALMSIANALVRRGCGEGGRVCPSSLSQRAQRVTSWVRQEGGSVEENRVCMVRCASNIPTARSGPGLPACGRGVTFRVAPYVRRLERTYVRIFWKYVRTLAYAWAR
jgi:hypothetical protein